MCGILDQALALALRPGPVYDNKETNACQSGPGAYGASLSSPGTLVLSGLIGARSRQMVNVRHNHIIQMFKACQHGLDL